MLEPFGSFRTRLLLLCTVVVALCVLTTSFGVMPAWLLTPAIAAACLFCTSFMTRYTEEERKFLDNGINPDTISWHEWRD